MTFRSRQIDRRSQLVLVFCFCLSCVATASAQTSTKTIIQQLTLQKYPVNISFELNGEPLKFKETVDTQQGFRRYDFEAGQDWLNQLTIKLKNISDKTIIYTNVNLRFPEVTKNGATALQQVFVGVYPYLKTSRPPLKLAPNETLEVQLAKETNDIRRLLVSLGSSAESVVSLWVEFHAALFDDDTLFEAGSMYRRNPDKTDPRIWIPVP